VFLGGPEYPVDTVRIEVPEGEEVYLDAVGSRGDSESKFRIQPPGGEIPKGFSIGLAFYSFISSISVLIFGLFVLQLAVATGFQGMSATGPVGVVRGRVIVAVAVLVPTALVFIFYKSGKAMPRGLLRRYRTPEALARGERTRELLVPIGPSESPWQACDLGRRPDPRVPIAPDGGAGLIVDLDYRGTGSGRLCDIPRYAKMAQCADLEPQLLINHEPVPAGWSMWWYPLRPGEHGVVVAGPVSADEVVVKLAPGEVRTLRYRAYLARDGNASWLGWGANAPKEADLPPEVVVQDLSVGVLADLGPGGPGDVPDLPFPQEPR
jgi:hypothetical protein